MKSIVMMGGLGNQMFQYALLLSMRQKKINVQLDTSYYDYLQMHNGYELEKAFGINERLYNQQGIHLLFLRFINKINLFNILKKDVYQYDATIFETRSKYIWGYWQDEKYFKSVEKIVREKFQFANIDSQNYDLANEMRQCNSVSLHIRRGDYSKCGMTIVGQNYYKEAIMKILFMVSNPVFFVFSDSESDADVILKTMNVNYRFIDINKGTSSYKDMYLMSCCHHNIIANSSFSWWGAWLNTFPDKIVIAPNTWMERRANLRPQLDEWIKL